MGVFRFRRYTWWAAAAVVTLSGRAAIAQAGTALDSATSAAIAPIVEQARAAKLPTAPLYAKAREGQVQRVPVPRIEAAVRMLADRMRVAHEALAPDATEQELSAAADAIKNGVPPETLRAMRKAGGDGSLAVPIGVLTQLIVRGVPVERRRFRSWICCSGAVARNFIALDESVRQDVLAGGVRRSLDLRLKDHPNLPQSTTADGAGLRTRRHPSDRAEHQPGSCSTFLLAGLLVVFAVLACFTCARTATVGPATTLDVGATHLTRDDFADTDGVTVAGLWSRWTSASARRERCCTRVSDGRSRHRTRIGVYAVPLNRMRLEGGATGSSLERRRRAVVELTAFGRAHLLERWGVACSGAKVQWSAHVPGNDRRGRGGTGEADSVCVERGHRQRVHGVDADHER
jgi:hypothetical protein